MRGFRPIRPGSTGSAKSGLEGLPKRASSTAIETEQQETRPLQWPRHSPRSCEELATNRTGAQSPRPAPSLPLEGASRPPGRALSSVGWAEPVQWRRSNVGRGNAVRFLARPSQRAFRVVLPSVLGPTEFFHSTGPFILAKTSPPEAPAAQPAKSVITATPGAIGPSKARNSDEAAESGT
jgi:hypothetical protein